MKLNKNEKFVLECLLKNPLSKNSEIAESTKITPQAIGKIRKGLAQKEIIKSQDLTLGYDKLGIMVHAIVLIKVLPRAFKKYTNHELDTVLKPINAIRSYAVPQTDVTHIIIYAFRDIAEYDNYFREIQKTFGEMVEIKDTYVLSSHSIIKSSSRELFLDVVKD